MIKQKIISGILALCMVVSTLYNKDTKSEPLENKTELTESEIEDQESESETAKSETEDQESESETAKSETEDQESESETTKSETEDQESESETAKSEIESMEPVYVTDPSTSKLSSKSIKLSWDSSQDAYVEYYYIMRRSTNESVGNGKWKTIANVKSDGIAGDSKNSYKDRLKSSKPQQYEYKICTLSKDQTIDTRNQKYEDETNKYTVLGTNIKICIDPGHYGSRNNNYKLKGGNGKYSYSEAKFTLKIGKALKKELKKTYGIDSYMTRTDNNISLKYKGRTYKNTKLDQNNIAIRGYMAKIKGCDFFISLHTNMAGRQKRPWNQPKSLNKVYVFVNRAALKSSMGMKIASYIGLELTDYNKSEGIQNCRFVKRSKNSAANYTNLINDISNGNGTVVHRKGSSGKDYYGVLRGANEKGIKGIIVEHAFHDTQVMRKHANASSDLYKNWAICDAYGIAKGLGL